MTVAELIEELKKMPQQAKVYVNEEGSFDTWVEPDVELVKECEVHIW